MTFMVTLIALIIERFFDWSHLRQWAWFNQLEAWVDKRFKHQSPYVNLAISIVPILLLILILHFLTAGFLYGVFNLVMQLMLVLYCFGPQNLWANGFACINEMANDEKAKRQFAKDHPDQSLQRHLIDNIFIEANRRVFAVVFWYVLLGPIGAVLYRTITLSANQPALMHAANTVEDVLNWIPTRILTILFALGGHFVSVLDCWRKKVLLGLDGNEILLTECGIAALGSNDLNNLPADGTIERHAISLIDRVFVILLVLLAMSVLLT